MAFVQLCAENSSSVSRKKETVAYKSVVRVRRKVVVIAPPLDLERSLQVQSRRCEGGWVGPNVQPNSAASDGTTFCCSGSQCSFIHSFIYIIFIHVPPPPIVCRLVTKMGNSPGAIDLKNWAGRKIDLVGMRCNEKNTGNNTLEAHTKSIGAKIHRIIKC